MTSKGEVNTEYWYDKGKKAIEKSLSKPQPITKKAKNVILFIGDGMSLITLTGKILCHLLFLRSN